MRVKSPTPSGFRDTSRLAHWLSTAFVTTSLIRVLHHEKWRAELQAWMVPGASSSVAELLHTIWYEDHPPRWYLCSYALTRFTD
jgi:hypothetical protein